jgi:hypothetical protein
MRPEEKTGSGEMPDLFTLIRIVKIFIVLLGFQKKMKNILARILASSYIT